jgi:hypothetical protein
MLRGMSVATGVGERTARRAKEGGKKLWDKHLNFPSLRLLICVRLIKLLGLPIFDVCVCVLFDKLHYFYKTGVFFGS